MVVLDVTDDWQRFNGCKLTNGNIGAETWNDLVTAKCYDFKKHLEEHDITRNIAVSSKHKINED